MISLKRLSLLTRFFWKTGVATEMSGGMGMLRSKRRGKGGFSLFGSKGRGERSNITNYIIYALSFAYMGFMLYQASKSTAQTFVAAGMPDMFSRMFLSGLVFLTILGGFFTTVSVFFLSQDRERILAMPFTMSEIVGARYITLVFYLSITPILFGLPIWITFGVVSGQPWIYYPKMIVMLLLFSIAPAAMISIIVLLLMRFTPMARNKDRFIMIVNVVMIVFTIGLVMFFSTEQGRELFQSDTLTETPANAGILGAIGKIFPTVPWLADFLHGSGTASWIALGKVLLLSIVLTAIALVVAHFFYGEAATSVGQGAAKKRPLKAADLQRAYQPDKPFASLFKREVKQIFRSPIFLVQNVLSSLLIFVMTIGMMIMGFLSAGGPLPPLSAMREQVNQVLMTDGSPDWLVMGIGVLAFSLIIFFIQGATLLNTTAISREGQAVYWMKIMPVSLKTQFAAKTLLSVLLSLSVTLILILALGIIFALPFWYIALALFSVFIAGLTVNLLSLWIDARGPMLDWENEQQLAKNSKNVLLGLVMSWIMAGIHGGLIYLAVRNEWNFIWFPIGALILQLLLLALSRWMSGRAIRRTMDHIEDYM